MRTEEPYKDAFGAGTSHAAEGGQTVFSWCEEHRALA
jgi:hypothetical protein